MVSRPTAWLVGLLVFLGGCADPTQLFLSVDADPTLRPMIRSLRVEVASEDSAGGDPGALDSHVFGETRMLRWPVQVAVAPHGGDPARGARIYVAAQDGDGGVVAGAVYEAEFVEDRLQRVTLHLADCCLNDPLCFEGTESDLDDGILTVECGEFRIPAVAPAAPPVLRSPYNGQTTGSVHHDRSRMPTFRWEPVDGATHYELELTDVCVHGACDFTAPTVITSRGTWHAIEEPLAVMATAPAGTTYGFRMRACNPTGCSGFGETRWFDVGRLESDVDGDGYSDLVVGSAGNAHLFRGSGGGPTEPVALLADAAGNGFGIACATGDIDGDGRAEILVGALDLEGSGSVTVFDGDATAIATLLGPPLGGSGFGASVAVVGDVDGDGFRDVVVGAPAEHAAYLFRGAEDLTGATGVRLNAPDMTADFGSGVVALGDVDGNGFPDFSVSAPATDRDDLAGSVVVFFGGDELTSRTVTMGAGRTTTEFGAAVRGNVDIDGDGLSDVLIGARGMRENSGGAFVFFGSPDIFMSDPPRMIENPQVSQGGFGAAVALVRDLDGDGRGEMVIGARHNVDRGVAGSGLVYTFGGFSPLDDTIEPNAVLSAEEAQGGASFGSGVTRIGDVNGDGFEDIAVAAPNWDGNAEDEGRVFVFLGTLDGFGAVADHVLDPPVAEPGTMFGVLP